MENNPSSKTDLDQLTMIEEKITKAGADPIIKKYAKGKLLGKGGFARCYEVTSLDTKKVLAAKIILKSSLTKSRAKQKLLSEIKIHKSLKHSGVVSFEHVFEDQENVYILLELCPHQSLHDLIKRRKRLTELEAQNYTLQIIQGLKYLHSKRVIHRDLKLGNLFLNEKMELKLGDFGLAAKLDFDGEKKRTVCGTPNYIAPEIIEGKTGHSYEVDIWSLGVIIYTLIIGRPPFETNDVKLTYKKIKACNYAFPEHVSISENAKNLISKILVLEPSKRPTLDEIMQHPFMRNGNNIPKLLPVSTLACPPSQSYINQFTAPENIIKVPVPSQPSTEATPLAVAKNGKGVNTQKNNLFNADKNTLTSPSSPGVTSTQTNENINSVPQLERLNSRGDRGFNYTRTGPWQLTNANSAQSLKDPIRPHTVNQRDFKSSNALKGINSLAGMGNNLRLSGSSSAVTRGAKSSVSLPHDVWVKKWVDYSSKYGLGYILSDGTFGVFFNDNTKLLLDPTQTKYEYVQRNKNDKQDQITSHEANDFPKEIQKKVTLLQHFRNYLEERNSDGSNDKGFSGLGGVYVKKWVKTKNATMFRLSNKIVQVNFVDKTEIILNSEYKQVTYVNKKGERTNYPLTTALENGNSDMAKRLKYTKELLTTMLNGNPPQSQIPTLNFQ